MPALVDGDDNKITKMSDEVHNTKFSNSYDDVIKKEDLTAIEPKFD